MTDANVQTTQVIEDTYVIITAATPGVQQQSSSVSSGFISNMLNPNPDTGIDSILNLNTESTSLVDVLVTTNVEVPPSSITTLPPAPIPHIQPQQQTPVSTPTIVPTKTSHVVVANLSELELKKILINKMENNKSIDGLVPQKILIDKMENNNGMITRISIDFMSSDSLILETVELGWMFVKSLPFELVGVKILEFLGGVWVVVVRGWEVVKKCEKSTWSGRLVGV
ncbi:hypothetical protein Tco_1336443 [Tanacetum coccineum]